MGFLNRCLPMAPTGPQACLCAMGLGSFLAVTSPSPAQAGLQLITNGSFSTTTLASPGGYICPSGMTSATCQMGSAVTGWDSTCNSTCGSGATVASLLYAGTNGSAFNGGIGLWSVTDSPGGGNFIAIDGDSTYTASLFQTIGGLSVGSEYILTFDQAAGQQKGTSGPTTEQWKVQFGSSSSVQYSYDMSTPTHGYVPWNGVTMKFIATSTSEVLTFFALGTPGGEPPVVLLDDVSLVLPEPPTFGIAAVGLVALAAARRRKRAA